MLREDDGSVGLLKTGCFAIAKKASCICTTISYYSARNARIASAVLATAIPSSVCPSVRHTPVLCQNDGT